MPPGPSPGLEAECLPEVAAAVLVSTIKLVVATCDPRPGRFGPILPEPRTVSSSTTTTVRPDRLLHPLRSSVLERTAIGTGVGLAGGHDLGEDGEDAHPVLLGGRPDDHEPRVHKET